MIAVCPSNEILKSLSLGELSEEQSDQLFRHVEQCKQCQIEMQSLDRSADTLIHGLQNIEQDSVQRLESEVGCRQAITRALAALAQADQPEVDPAIPRQIGEYEIVKPLGQGGMGHVYLGQHTKLGRPVAIKLIADHRRWDQTMHRRFASEMKLIGRLNHPNIVVAHDAREVDGLAVLVTEFIDGMTVSEILKRQGKLSLPDACQITHDVCRALSYIDSQGLVHRDIKPSNIMIDRSGAVKLLDLGLARLQSSDDAPGHFTATGQAMGTADYVAPEQIEDGRNVDIRADVYGLGCTLYKVLCGVAPFDDKQFASSFAKMNAHVSSKPDSIGQRQSGLPADIVTLVDQMLEKRPGDRPANPELVGNRLQKHLHKADLAGLVERCENLTIERDKPVPPIKLGNPEQSGRRKFPWLGMWILGLSAFLFGLWLGIVIKIKMPDGSMTAVKIPEGSTAVVDHQGNIVIHLPNSHEQLFLDKKDVHMIGPDGEHTVDDVSAAEPQESDHGDHDQLSPVPESSFLVHRHQGAIVMGHFALPKNSELYGTVESGDEVDMFVLDPADPMANDSAERQLVATKKKVMAVTDNSTKIQVSFSLSDTEAQRALRQLEPKPQFEFEFHDPQRLVLGDAVRLDGVWRIVLQKMNGNTTVSRNSSVVFCQDKVFLLQNEDIHQQEFVVENGMLKPPKLDRASFCWKYRFISRGRIEVEFVDSKTGAPIFENGALLRMDKISRPATEQERLAFKIHSSPGNAKTKIDFWIATQADPRSDKAKKVKQTGESIHLEGGRPILSNTDIVGAFLADSEHGREQLDIRLTPKGQLRVENATGRNINKRMAILIDGEVVSAPRIVSRIGGKTIRVELDMDKAKAKTLAENIVGRIEIPRDTNAWRQTNRRASLNKLKKLALAFHYHHSTNRRFPSSKNRLPSSPDLGLGNAKPKDLPAHSWRVAILKFLDDPSAKKIYESYQFDEPWDSEHNLRLAQDMPDVFRHPSMPRNSTTTNYVGLTDKDCILGVDKALNFGDILDGTSNTVMLVEAKTEIPWTKPEDIDLTFFNQKKYESNDFIDQEAICIAMADGSSWAISGMPYESWKKLLTAQDGTAFDFYSFSLKFDHSLDPRNLEKAPQDPEKMIEVPPASYQDR